MKTDCNNADLDRNWFDDWYDANNPYICINCKNQPERLSEKTPQGDAIV